MDKKITQLPAAASVTVDDLIPIVDAPGTAPVTQKATVQQFITLVETMDVDYFNLIGNAYKGGDQTGNALGAHSMDVQTSRTALAHVSSGAYSATFGVDNQSSGLRGMAIGFNNYATATDTSAFGHFCNSTANYAASFGWTNVASGIHSLAFGSNNTAGGDYSGSVGNQCQSNGPKSAAIGYLCTSGGNQSSAFGYKNTSSGNLSSAFGYNCTASAANTSAFGFSSTASYPSASSFGRSCNSLATASNSFGYGCTASGNSSVSIGVNCTASGTFTTTLGFACTASGVHGNAFGYRAQSRIDNCTNICGPQIIRKDNGEGGGAEFFSFCGVEVVLMTFEADLKTPATQTITLPAGCHFWLDEVFLVDTVHNTVSVQPFLSFGITGTNNKYINNQQSTLLTAALKRERWLVGGEDGETSLTATVVTGSTATAHNGRFGFRGLLIEDE